MGSVAVGGVAGGVEAGGVAASGAAGGVASGAGAVGGGSAGAVDAGASAPVGVASMPGGVALKNTVSNNAPSSVMPTSEPKRTRKFIRLRLPCLASVGDTTVVRSRPKSGFVTVILLCSRKERANARSVP